MSKVSPILETPKGVEVQPGSSYLVIVADNLLLLPSSSINLHAGGEDIGSRGEAKRRQHLSQCPDCQLPQFPSAYRFLMPCPAGYYSRHRQADKLSPGLLLCIQPHTAMPSRLQQQHGQASRRPQWLHTTAD